MFDDTSNRHGATPIPPYILAVVMLTAVAVATLFAVYPPLYHLVIKALSTGPRPRL